MARCIRLGQDRHTVFTDNMRLPVHGWYRYPAGFSARWVSDLMRGYSPKTVFDPFAGSGTTLLEAHNMESLGTESHPFVYRIAAAKLQWDTDIGTFNRLASSVLRTAERSVGGAGFEDYPALIQRCFTQGNLSQLEALRAALEGRDDSPGFPLVWLALVSIIRECSHAGTAPWQYVLPNRTKARVSTPLRAFRDKVQVMSGDMASRQAGATRIHASLLQGDARTCSGVPDQWADLVVTSPPYANNYDYADATRLEQSLMGEVSGYGDLRETRRRLVASCTQHVGKNGNHPDDSMLGSVRDDVLEACDALESRRDLHAGRKPYHRMVRLYFHDMARVWRSLRRVTHGKSRVCFVVGDSAPYGVHVHTEDWLGRLALSAGFSSYRFEKVRDRNTKWRNRKHTVPLQEGLLWVEG